MLKWGFKKNQAWPETESGEPVPPVFLTNVNGGALDMELTLNLLEAYGIPTLRDFPHNGLLGKLIMGYAQGGTDIYVPETLLEDAQNLLHADIIEETAEDENA